MLCPSSFQPPGFFDTIFADPALLIGGLLAWPLLLLGFRWLWQFWLGRNPRYAHLSKQQSGLYRLSALGGGLCLPGLLLVALSIQWGNAASNWLASVGGTALFHCTFSVMATAYNTGTPYDPGATDPTFQALLAAYQRVSNAQTELLDLALMIAFAGLALVAYSVMRIQEAARSIETQ